MTRDTRSWRILYPSSAKLPIASVGCGSPWGQTFAYDAFGNVTKTGNGGTSYMATYNAQTNQVASGVTATYDANGNQMQTNFVSPMSYDAKHNAVVAGSTSMTYDALGRLVEAGGKPVVYGPSGEKIGVFNGTSSVASFALPGGGEAYYTNAVLTSLRRKDWLGSSRLATSWGHAVVSKAAYAPYGENYGGGGTTDLDFTGQTQATVSTLFDFPARKYDPNAGRWTVPDPGAWGVVDPTNPQSFNRYAYVLNSPMSMVDPGGLDYCSVNYADSPCGEQYQLAMEEAQAEQDPGASAVDIAGAINMQQYSAEFDHVASQGEAFVSYLGVLAINAAANTGSYQPAVDSDYFGSGNLEIQKQYSAALENKPTGAVVCYQGGCIIPGGPAPSNIEWLPTCHGLGVASAEDATIALVTRKWLPFVSLVFTSSAVIEKLAQQEFCK